ncbi:exported hypothetical protein [Candidatus Zixiibacteriota bacterium]|nr:exported hypothetical protein [candidate division Zixibacteria bacterium]
MKKSVLLITTAIVLILAAGAMAQDEGGKTRNFEVGVYTGLSLPMGDLKNWNDSMGAKTGFDFGLSGGYFLKENLSLGGYFTYTQFPVKLYSNMHYRFYNVGAYCKYAFVGESDWEPYVKIKAGADFAKFATWTEKDLNRLRELSYKPGLGMSLGAGILRYTSDNGGLFLEGEYHFAPLKSQKATYRDVDYKFDHNVNFLSFRFGVNVFFGGGQ